MCLVLSRCGFDLSAAEWSLSYIESLTHQLLSPSLYASLSLLSVLSPPLPALSPRVSDLHLNIFLFKRQSLHFYLVPCYTYMFLYLSPLALFLFALQASELGMLSVYYTYIFTSLVRKWEMVWAFKSQDRFHSYRSTALEYCCTPVVCNVLSFN